MVINGPRDQDKLDGASNFVIWKARILAVLNDLKLFVIDEDEYVMSAHAPLEKRWGDIYL